MAELILFLIPVAIVAARRRSRSSTAAVALVGVMTVMVPAHARADRRAACPEYGMTRCHHGRLEQCTGPAEHPRWARGPVCEQPETCVEEDPGEARCGLPGLKAKIVRRATDAAMIAVMVFVIASGGLRRVLE